MDITSPTGPPSSGIKIGGRGRRRGGFSFVELLCVVAIVALMGNLLFPAMQAARSRAQSTVCAANLHQLGVALALSSADNNNHYPEVENNPAQPIYPPSAGAQSLALTFQPYGITPKMLQCPADVLGPNYAAQTGSSYQWRPFLDNELVGAPDLYFGTAIIPVSSSRICVAFDYTPVHRNRQNRLYGDGHVIFH